MAQFSSVKFFLPFTAVTFLIVRTFGYSQMISSCFKWLGYSKRKLFSALPFVEVTLTDYQLVIQMYRLASASMIKGTNCLKIERKESTAHFRFWKTRVFVKCNHGVVFHVYMERNQYHHCITTPEIMRFVMQF